jgi:flavin-dependent dehydrogenase
VFGLPIDEFDVAVVGGGIAGAGSAIALRNRGLSVAIIERGNYDRERIGEVLPSEVKDPLCKLGLWNEFLDLGCGHATARLSSWGASRLSVFDYMFNPYGDAWVIERPAFDRFLVSAAIQRGARLFRSARAREYCREYTGLWLITIQQTEGARQIRARFVILATGRSPLSLPHSNNKRAVHDLLISITGCVLRPPGWARDDYQPLVESVSEGWWYSVLLPGGIVNVAFMTDSDIARKKLRLSKSRNELLETELSSAQHTRERMNGQLKLLGSARVTSANTYLNEDVGRDESLRVGDAVGAIDPLAGQGSYAALDGASRAAEVVAARLQSGINVSEGYSLAERERFGRLLVERTAYYRIENRWPSSSFWSRRFYGILPAKSLKATAVKREGRRDNG